MNKWLSDHEFADLLEGLVQQLLISKPGEPHSFLIEVLAKTKGVPGVHECQNFPCSPCTAVRYVDNLLSITFTLLKVTKHNAFNECHTIHLLRQSAAALCIL